MINRRFFDVTLVWIVAGVLFAQDLSEFPVDSYTVKDGLPSNEVFHIVEGLEGYLWIASTNGLSRYNGKEHKVYDTRHGLPNTAVYHLFSQKDSSLVGVCSNAEFFRFKDGKARPLIERDSLLKYIKTNGFPYSFYQDSLGHVHFGSRKGYFHFGQNSELIEMQTKRTMRHRVIGLLKNRQDPTFIFDISPLETAFQTRLSIWDGDSLKALTKSTGDQLNRRSIYPTLYKGYLVIPLPGYLAFFDGNDELETLFPISYDCIGAYAAGDYLFAGTHSDGVYIYTLENGFPLLKYHFFEGFSISSVTKSADDSFWFSTLENGIRKLNIHGAKQVYIPPRDEKITCFSFQKDQLFVGFESGKMYSEKRGIYTLSNSSIKIYSLFFNERGLSIPGHGFFAIDSLGNPTKQRELFPIYQDIKPVNDSEYICITYSSVLIMNLMSGDLRYLTGEGQDLFYAIHQVGQRFYCLSRDKILLYTPGVDSIKTIRLESSPVLVFQHQTKTYVIGQDATVYTLDPETDSPKLCIQMNEIVSVISGCYYQGVLHVSTNSGVYSWGLPIPGKEPLKLKCFLPIPLVEGFSIHEDYLYFFTAQKLYKKALSSMKMQVPAVKISKVHAGDSIYRNVGEIKLRHNNNHLVIHLNHLSFQQPLKKYKYKMGGHESKYYFTTQAEINYTELSPGNYEFRVSGTSDGYNYSPEQTLKVNILPPFWTTWWFRLTSSSLALGLTYFLIQNRIRRIKSKAALQQTLAELKSQALTAQLNPHLVFNVMNSIQGMVVEQKAEEANILIAQFSNYLRNSLNKSKLSLVSIHEEIMLLKQYLDLEKQRFGHQLHISLRTDLDNGDIQVPPLILQPLVENAIKHGVRPKLKEVGIIHIEILQERELLRLIVEDNGVGFKDPVCFGDGLQITRERLNAVPGINSLQILCKRNPTKVEIRIAK